MAPEQQCPWQPARSLFCRLLQLGSVSLAKGCSYAPPSLTLHVDAVLPPLPQPGVDHRPPVGLRRRLQVVHRQRLPLVQGVVRTVAGAGTKKGLCFPTRFTARVCAVVSKSLQR